jgi:hypothetical protein
MKWVLIAVVILIGIVALVAAIGAMLPRAHVASRSSRFRQPPQAVWEAITGPPDWRPDVSAFERLAPREGHRAWKETDKHGQAIAYESVEEVPPSRLVTRIASTNLPFGGSWTHEIAPDAGGCVLKITEDGEIYNPIFRFMARFVLGYHGSIDTYIKALHAKFGEAAD